jgi:hypothetical protein
MPIEGVAGENRLGVIHVWMDVRSMTNRKRIVPEREGSPEAGFPVEGEASMNAHLVPRPRDARGLFHLPPRLKRAWPGPDVKKPGHFVAGPSLAEREGLPGAGFPVEGEASMNAHLASLVDFFTSLPGSSELGLVRM